jgi:O-antigen/teichoic acid export membrane protein
MNRIKAALIFSAMGNYSVQILGFISVIVLTRVLTPDEIGIYAVAGSITLLAAEIRTLGVVQYLIREKELDENKIRSVLGMAIIVSWSLGLILICSAPIIAEFYSEPALRGILWILGTTFFIGPFTSVPIALWRRNLQFQPIFIQKSVGALTTSACMILLVLLDLSYYGLAIGVVAGLISELIVAIYLRPAGTVWLPRVSWLGKLVKFGFFASSTNLYCPFFRRYS